MARTFWPMGSGRLSSLLAVALRFEYRVVYYTTPSFLSCSVCVSNGVVLMVVLVSVFRRRTCERACWQTSTEIDKQREC